VQENDIFTNQKEVVENLRGSAQNLGIDPEKVAPSETAQKKQKVYVAKKNCKKCWGQGVLTLAGHDVAVKTKNPNLGFIASKASEEGTQTLLPVRGKFQKTEGRNSSKPEPEAELKKKALIYCSCVKIVESILQRT
jgi:hypothetical protein